MVARNVDHIQSQTGNSGKQRLIITGKEIEGIQEK
jgi:hypothetical protein